MAVELENVELFEVTCGDDSPLTASALRGLGEAYIRRNRLPEAIQALARSYHLEASKDAFDLLSVMEAPHMRGGSSASGLSRGEAEAVGAGVSTTCRAAPETPEKARGQLPRELDARNTHSETYSQSGVRRVSHNRYPKNARTVALRRMRTAKLRNECSTTPPRGMLRVIATRRSNRQKVPRSARGHAHVAPMGSDVVDLF